MALVEFLANFTFAADGQVSKCRLVASAQFAHACLGLCFCVASQVGCIKVGGMLSGIVRTLAYDLVEAQRAATLAIRNMCFHRE